MKGMLGVNQALGINPLYFRYRALFDISVLHAVTTYKIAKATHHRTLDVCIATAV